MAKSPSVQMKKLMDDFSKEVQEAMDEALKEVPKAAVQKLKNTSPRKTGDYASGWTVKNEKRSAIIYNRKKPQLTHLLENGHVIRNKTGTYGRVSGRQHIKPVEEWASNELPLAIERRLTK